MAYGNNFQRQVRGRASSETDYSSANATSSPLQAKIDSGRQLTVQQKRVTAIQKVLQQKSLSNRISQARTPENQAAATHIVQRARKAKPGKAVPDAAREMASFVRDNYDDIMPGGTMHVPNVRKKDLMGFERGPDQHYVGGSAYNNTGKLPHTEGHTYQEWDVNPAVAERNRGAVRIVTSSNGKFYYTDDHYKSFTEFIP